MKKKTTKKTSKAIAKIKQKDLVITKEQKDLTRMFAGSSALVKANSSNERDLILLVAEGYGLPAVCVNVMGGLPYINKDGLLYKLNEYEGNKVISLVSKGIQYARKTGERAIIKSTLTLDRGNGKTKIYTAIGEADNASVKLEAVKATPNMMAETRSVNRVINKAIKARILRDVYIALGKRKDVDDGDRKIIEGAVESTAEELNVGKKAPVKISRGALLQRSMKTIMETTDPTKLTEMYEQVTSATVYTEMEKKTLIRTIANQRKKNAEQS